MSTRNEVGWLLSDAKDDFFADLFRFRDLETVDSKHLADTSADTAISSSVPKNSLFQRYVQWIAPSLRLQYLALTRELMEDLAPTINERCYSYRPSGASTAVPFPAAAQDWLRFRTDFRTAVSVGGKWAIQTDISSYFDHLLVERVAETLNNFLPSHRSNNRLKKLRDLLLRIAGPHHTLPQNNDASSFLGSAYLANVDSRISAQRGIEYFRYQDDIGPDPVSWTLFEA